VEEREGSAGGPVWLRGPEVEMGRGRKLGYAGRKGKGGRGLGGFFFLFFSNPFQTNFKPFQIQIFYMFLNSNFNTNFSNYFKGFSQTLFF
jgi:hypothetical protein